MDHLKLAEACLIYFWQPKLNKNRKNTAFRACIPRFSVDQARWQCSEKAGIYLQGSTGRIVVGQQILADGQSETRAGFMNQNREDKEDETVIDAILRI